MKINISQPCHESWAEMTPVEKGRFCQSCQKTVFDFTTATDTQIFNLLKDSTSQVCGRFKASQLNRDLIIQKASRFNWLRMTGLVISSWLTIVKANAQDLTPFTTSISLQDNVATENNQSDFSRSATDFRKITGKVTDKTGEALIGVSIHLKGTTIGTMTDLDGMYELNVPILENQTSIIIFGLPGFDSQEVLLSESKSVDILLNETESLVISNWFITGGLGITSNSVINRNSIFSKRKTEPCIITGQVSDESGEPLIGARITEKTSGLSAFTDIDGQYFLSIPGEKISTALEVVCKYVGYDASTKKAFLKDKNVEMNFQMESPAALGDTISILEETTFWQRLRNFFKNRIAIDSTEGQTSIEEKSTITTSVSEKIEIKCIPNPFSERFSVEFELPEDEFLKLILSDESGNILWQSENNYSKGNNRIPIERLPIAGKTIFISLVQQNGLVRTIQAVQLK